MIHQSGLRADIPDPLNRLSGLWVIWVYPQNFSILLHRLLALTASFESSRQIEMGIRIVRRLSSGCAKVLQSLVHSPKTRQQDGQVGVREWIRLLNRQRMFEQHDGLIRVSNGG